MVCRSSALYSDRECIRRARGGTRNARPKTQFEFDVLQIRIDPTNFIAMGECFRLPYVLIWLTDSRIDCFVGFIVVWLVWFDTNMNYDPWFGCVVGIVPVLIFILLCNLMYFFNGCVCFAYVRLVMMHSFSLCVGLWNVLNIRMRWRVFGDCIVYGGYGWSALVLCCFVGSFGGLVAVNEAFVMFGSCHEYSLLFRLCLDSCMECDGL